MKEKFYIFLDIDGVMFDYNFILSYGIEKFKIIETFDPECVAALNYLIESLSDRFNPQLVISSSWRRNMKHTIQTLFKHGLNIDINCISRTEITNHSDERGKEILDYLNKENCINNFVIIDDDMFDFEKYFSKKKIIKTDVHKESLRKHMVDKFLKENKLIETHNQLER